MVSNAPAGAAPPSSAERKRTRFSYSRIVVINAVILIVLAGVGAFAYNYISNVQGYVSTDNANIDGVQVSVAAPAAGVLIKWDGTVGKTVRQGDVLGQIQVPGTVGKPIDITAPQDGTVVVSNAVPDSFAAPGTSLAVTYDLRSLFVTARVQETDINNVKTGQHVDVYVDAFPNNKLTGTVDQIGFATSSVFSVLPPTNTSGNYQKVTQVVPIRIKLDDQGGLRLVPGLNCTVKVHRS